MPTEREELTKLRRLAALEKRLKEADLHKRQKEFQERPWYDKAMAGFDKPIAETIVGVKSLFGGLSPEDAAYLEKLKEVSGPVGTAGELAGNIATFAAPGGLGTRAATKGVSMLPKALAKFAAARPGIAAATGGAAGVGAMEGLRDPGTLPERAKSAATGAAVTAAFPAAIGPLTRTMKGLKRPPAAQEMLDEGIPLTPGATGGKFRTPVENFMAKTPLIAGSVNRQRQAALDSWNKKMLREVAPPGTVVDDVGTKGIQQVQNAFNRYYDDLWNRVNIVGPQTSAGFNRGVQEANERLIPKHAKRVSTMLNNWNKQVGLAQKAENTGRQIDKLDDEIRAAIAKAKTPAEKTIFESARKSLRAGLPEGADDALNLLDKQYAKYSVIQRAANTARARRADGVFTPNDLTAAVRQQSTPYKSVGGEALLHPEAKAAQETVGKALPVAGSGAIGNVAALGAGYLDPVITGGALTAGRLAATEPVRRALTGGPLMNRQGRMARALRQGGPYTLAGKKVFEDEDEPKRPAPIYNPARR